MLLGRDPECTRLDALIVDGRRGVSAALVLRGEHGIGKTALLTYLAERATDWHVLRAAGAESEMELPFAGLHQLCLPMLEERSFLPAPQSEALGTAFGLGDGPPPARFLIGLAVLTLLSQAAADTPLLCLVDDVDWMDRSSVQVLAFVARRLQAESVVMVFAEREPRQPDDLARIPELSVAGVGNEDARALLRATVAGPLDDRVRDRVLLESRGNPLALLELPGHPSPADLAGGFGLPDAPTLSRRLEATYHRRVKQLPSQTQSLLLAAAADPTGEATLLWRAASILGVPADALVPAQTAGLIEVGARVAFCNSLIRSAVYGDASPVERRRAHQALAEATDIGEDPDRRAWHLAHATSGTDDTVADELERSAARAHDRGGLAASAAFLEKAVALTTDPAARSRRALAAAHAHHAAGAPEGALRLLASAAAAPGDETHSAMMTRLHGLIALDLRRGNDAVPLLLDAAARLATIDANLSRETYMEAMRAASITGRLGDGVVEVARAARRAPPPVGPASAVDLLLDGLALRFTEGYAASAEALKEALRATREEGGSDGNVRWPWQARRVAPDLLDDEAWHHLSTRNVENARSVGALGMLPLALNSLACASVVEGNLKEALVLIEEADAICQATDTTPILFARAVLTGWAAQDTDAAALLEASRQAVDGRREGVILSFTEWACATLLNGLGRYEEAIAPARSAVATDELMLSVWAMPELIEAASRSGQPDLARTALDQFTACTQAAGTDLALGLEARCRALLSSGVEADGLYLEAAERLARTRNRTGLARTQLLYGEWLRREGHRSAARVQLRAAHDMLAAAGANGFADRAGRELLATGESVRKRGNNDDQGLTSQELQIARLAAAGHTNTEIGAQLFISPRTVEWHLRKTFSKLAIVSRRQLRDVLSTVGVVP